MKKLFTTAFALAFMSAFSYGQRICDVSIQSIDGPAEIESSSSTGSVINLNIAVYNDGPDDLKTGDTIFYLMQIAKNNSVIVQTNGANQGYVTRGPVLSRDVIPGDTFHFVVNLTTTTYMTQSVTCDVNAAVIVANRPDLPFEDQSTIQNNFGKKTGITWWNEEKWAVSVQDVNKDLLRVYPNPANNHAILNRTAIDASATTVVSVYDIKGTEVATVTKLAGDNSPIEINTAQLNNGVYVVKVNNGEQQHTTKMVVNH
ncbi:MAG: T9SS type A sorting domain-containing protein [Bacteroidetes bacterium]|nr:T9SS type A sorting domain-containing protein [Bacteroidota bacterium]